MLDVLVPAPGQAQQHGPVDRERGALPREQRHRVRALEGWDQALLAAAEADLRSIVSEIEKFVDEKRGAELRELQNKWRTYRDSWAEFESEAYKGGTIRPMLYAGSAEAMTREWIEKLKNYLQWLKRDLLSG